MSPDDTADPEQHQLERERWELLRRIERWLEVPMLVLGIVWLLLLCVELVWEEVWRRNPLLETLSAGAARLPYLSHRSRRACGPRSARHASRQGGRIAQPRHADGIGRLVEDAGGRVLCVVLALYAFAVFGYGTATLAT
jgi:hypothetical protein